MLTKRIIPCLDVKDGRVVKGTNFINLRDAGDAVELSRRYYKEGADELVFLDITATEEKRSALLHLVEAVAKEIRIPFTVGGGISSIRDMDSVLKAGADKIAINSAAVHTPNLITEASKKFGSQAVVVAIDAKLIDGHYKVFIKGGKEATSLDAIEWCAKVVELGAGEILLTSMDKDGSKSGYEIELLNKVRTVCSVPVIASGGAGINEHFLDAFLKTDCDACLAASLFHYRELEIGELKEYLKNNGIAVRL